MQYKLIIDKTMEEAVTVCVHERSSFTEQLEALILQYTGADRIAGFAQDDWKLLSVTDIECITVEDGKTYAIDRNNTWYRLKHRLYELEAMLPASFIRINKSALANENRLERFAASFNGAVDAVFKCGYREPVSRRCFAEIKRRYDV